MNIVKDTVIIGSGGFAKEILFLIDEINNINKMNFKNPIYNVLGFINNDPNTWGMQINNIPIIGDDNWVLNYMFPLNVVIGIGSPYIKRKIVQRFGNKVNYPNLIHPSVIKSNYIKFGCGIIITAGSVLTTNIEIKDHAMINLACTIGHDVKINSYAVLSPGVNVSGNVSIGEGTYIGTGTTILEENIVGHWSTVGAGAMVNKNVDDNATVVGVPAKQIKIKEAGWQEQ